MNSRFEYANSKRSHEKQPEFLFTVRLRIVYMLVLGRAVIFIPALLASMRSDATATRAISRPLDGTNRRSAPILARPGGRDLAARLKAGDYLIAASMYQLASDAPTCLILQGG